MTGIFRIGQHRWLDRWPKYPGGECLNEGRKIFKVTMGNIFALFILYTHIYLNYVQTPLCPTALTGLNAVGVWSGEVCSLLNCICGPCSYLVKVSRARCSSLSALSYSCPRSCLPPGTKRPASLVWSPESPGSGKSSEWVSPTGRISWTCYNPKKHMFILQHKSPLLAVWPC